MTFDLSCMFDLEFPAGPWCDEKNAECTSEDLELPLFPSRATTDCRRTSQLEIKLSGTGVIGRNGGRVRAGQLIGGT